MTRSVILAVALLLPSPVVALDGCEPEPASQWAPSGWICPPLFGDGTASRWQGPGVARNDCQWPWTDCQPIRITSHQTGLSVIVTPSMWCHCWTGVSGPSGETRRIVDLDPATLSALGLDSSAGLFSVNVEPAPGWAVRPAAAPAVPALPDTATLP